MGKHEKRAYLEAIRNRYCRANRTDQGKIPDEFCSVCGYQRKYAIRLLGCKSPKLFGYERFDNLKRVKPMNALYAKEWSQLQHHCCPTLKLKTKGRDGARYRKQYYAPETPYQRVMVCESVSDDTKSKLRILRDSLNPFDLRQQINAKLRTLFSMVEVTSVVRQRS
jgi:hypothetical protein